MKARQLITPCLIFKNHCTPLDSSRDGSRDDTFVLWARDEFDGLPIAWTVTEEELCKVKGLGKVKAARLTSMLQALPLAVSPEPSPEALS